MGGIIYIDGDLFGRAWADGMSKFQGITGRMWRMRFCENVKKAWLGGWWDAGPDGLGPTQLH